VFCADIRQVLTVEFCKLFRAANRKNIFFEQFKQNFVDRLHDVLSAAMILGKKTEKIEGSCPPDVFDWVQGLNERPRMIENGNTSGGLFVSNKKER